MQKIKASIIAGAVCCLALGGSVAGASQVLRTDIGVQETDIRETVEKQGGIWTCTGEYSVNIDGKDHLVKQSGPCTVWQLGRAYEELQSRSERGRMLDQDLIYSSERENHYKRLSEDQSKLLEELAGKNPEIKEKVEKLKSRLSGPSRTGR